MVDQQLSSLESFDSAREAHDAVPVDAYIINIDCLNDFNFKTKIAPYLTRADRSNLTRIEKVYLKINQDEPKPLKDFICDLTTIQGAKEFWNAYVSGDLLDADRSLISPKIFLVTPSGVKDANLHDVCNEIKVPADIGAKIFQPTLFNPNTSRTDANLSQCTHAVFAEDVDVRGTDSRTVDITLPKGLFNIHLVPQSGSDQSFDCKVC